MSGDAWSLSQDGEFLLYKGWYTFPTTKMSDLMSFVPTMTIIWLDIQVLVRPSPTFDGNSTGPTLFDLLQTTFDLAQLAIETSPSITSHSGPIDSSPSLFDLGTPSPWISLRDFPYLIVSTQFWSSFVTYQKWASSSLWFETLMPKTLQ